MSAWSARDADSTSCPRFGHLVRPTGFLEAWSLNRLIRRTYPLRKEVRRNTTQRITEWVPGKKVVWHVVDSHINFVKDRTEWNGTDIVFDIDRQRGKTELRFTHVGLVPAFECYGDCSGAWGFYINDSLRSLITTGQGQPNQTEEENREKASQ